MAEPSLSSPLGSALDDNTLPSAKRTTALSTKLTQILSTTYTDHEIRDTLRLLDSRPSTQNNNRNLKAQAQKEAIDLNTTIVDDFGAVAAQLKRVGGLITQLNNTCEDLRRNVSKAKAEVAPTLEESDVLLRRKAETETKEDVLQAFKTHFLLGDEDLRTLTSSAEPLDAQFFSVLDRAKHISKDCEILLSYSDGPSTDGEEPSSRLGLDILSQTTAHIDAAFKKLYTWIQARFRTLDIEDPHISGSIRRALRVLSERPALFQNCLDSFAEARRRTLGEAFQDALTGGRGGAKAIEFSTHEPLRYVGDMLAWVHSAAVSEKEALEGLFVGDEEEIRGGLREGRRFGDEPWTRLADGNARARGRDSDDDDDETKADEVFDGRKALSDLIFRNLTLVCQTLQSRIEVTVRTANSPVLMFKIYNLLDFYHGIFAKLLDNTEHSLAEFVSRLSSSTLEQFDKVVEDETSAAVAAIEHEDAGHDDLTPPVPLATALSQFSEICRTRGPAMQETELERISTSLLGRILTACQQVASNIPDSRRSAIYKLNYMTALKTTLSSISAQVRSTSAPLADVSRQIDKIHTDLTDLVANTFLEYSGISDLLQELDSRRKHDAETESRKWFEDNLDDFAQKLDEFLGSAVMDAQEALKQVIDRTLAKDVVSEAVERFCEEFDELEGMLEKFDGDVVVEGEGEGEELEGKPSLRALYPRTGDEVRALLS